MINILIMQIKKNTKINQSFFTFYNIQKKK